MHLTEIPPRCFLPAVVAVSAWAFGAGPAAAQGGTVEGHVTAASTGAPIASAEVSVVGTNLGTRTNAEGRFVLLHVPAGPHDLRILAIGFKLGTLRLTVAPDTATTADVQLTPSVLELDAVVVTGTAGVARVRELGNTISRIDLAKDVKDPPASVDQLLQARTPGLSVMQSTGSAGAGAQIRLRGAVSVSQSNQPIVYIDGIRVRSEGYRRNRPAAGTDFEGRSTNVQSSPLNDVNPADIERIEIIKGAAASTLYGTEAAAGVIQIFTKKGARSEPRWTLQIDQGFAKLLPFGTDWNPHLNFTPGDSVVLDATNQLRTAVTYSDSSAGYCPDLVAAARSKFERTGTFDPVRACSFLRTGHRQKVSGSVTGGFGGFQYFLSGSQEDYEGVLPQDDEKKLVTRGNFGFDLSDKIRLDVSAAYSHLNIRNTPSGNNAQGLTLNVYRAERNYRQTSNPIVLDSLLHQRLTSGVDRLIAGGTVYYTPFPRLTNRFTIGLDLANQENRGLRPFGFVAEPLGVLFDEQNKYLTLTADYVGNLDFRLGTGLGSTFSFGGQSVTTEEVSTHAFGRGFGGPGEPTVTSASLFISRESRIRVLNAGFFFQNVFKLRDRYFLTLGARFDGNSAFGRDFGIQTYPKASASYVVSDEPFWPTAWGELKLRAAFGWSGRAPGAFDAVRTWIGAASGGQPAALPNNLGNPDLGPERTRETEFGFDGGFFQNRVSATFTWYHRKTTDALFPVRQIPSLGILNTQLTNIGAIRNSGVEAAINATVFQRESWGLDLGTSVYTNSSLVLDLGIDAKGVPVAPFLTGAGAAGGGWMEEGFAVMAAKGTRIKNANAIAAPDTLCDRAAGDPCAIDGQYIFGPQQPTFVWGVSATVRLPRGITLSARGEYQGGAWIYQASAANALQRSVRWPTCRRAHLILEGGGAVSALTARERLECVPATLQDDVLWEPQDFFKLRDVTLSVPLGNLIARASGATLTLTAQNWVRWYNSDLRMFDPEMTDRDSLNEQNRNISEHIPPPALFTAALRVTF